MGARLPVLVDQYSLRGMNSRRDFLKTTALVGAAALPLGSAAETLSPSSKIKVVCVGGHPDDPESSSAGTLARYADTGHSVTILYLTRGERGIRNTSLDEAAKIRTAECEAACKIIGAKPVFFGQIDGDTSVTKAHVERMTKLLAEENPQVVFTHWPIDTHMDHQVASFLTIRACMNLGYRFALYFFEVNSGSQTQGFFPNTYVDVTGVLDEKKNALFAHVSQDGQGVWREHHEIIANWRGREAGVKAAEAFVRFNRDSKLASLPGI
jgi:LmbE family N-acetylglucosaminyl deacetylase